MLEVFTSFAAKHDCETVCDGDCFSHVRVIGSGGIRRLVCS